jgi:hypothetical protein
VKGWRFSRVGEGISIAEMSRLFARTKVRPGPAAQGFEYSRTYPTNGELLFTRAATCDGLSQWLSVLTD